MHYFSSQRVERLLHEAFRRLVNETIFAGYDKLDPRASCGKHTYGLSERVNALIRRKSPKETHASVGKD